ncbi:MAG: hypothetical protein JNM18_22955, partial [Planctomycetaceae bacterium]|nr:hypothetical protein [Planctomycetaceae bacterium]
IATLVDLESLDCVLAKQEPKLTKNGLPQLAALGQLRHLKLGRMGTRDTDPAFLGSFPRLESLSLHFVAYSGWEPYVARMSSLKSLSLYSIDDASSSN